MLARILLIIVLIGMSALFSGSEMAFASSSEIKLRRKKEEAPSASNNKAYEVFTRFEDALVSILIGNNLVNIGSSAVATVIAIGIMGDSGAGAATAIMTVLIITFGEITPKILAARAPEKCAQLAAIPIRFIMTVTWPVVWLVKQLLNLLSKLWKDSETDDTVTEDDLETMLDTAEDEGVVDEDTHDLLQSALDFDDVLAYEIITPRVDMYCIDIDDGEEEIAKAVLACPYTRIPIYRDTPDHILGFVLTTQCYKEMLDGGKLDLEALMLKPRFVHKTMPLPDVLDLMKKTKCHLVIVTDEYGGTMGMLTMEDVMEQLVGEIWDEKDVIDEEFVELSDDEFEADGSMRIDDFFDELDMDEDDFDDDNATLGGWAIEMLEGYPRQGDSFDYKNLSLTVSEIDGMRVTSLHVKVHPLPEESEEE